MQGGEVLQHVGEALVAHFVGPFAFELADDFSRGAHLRSSTVGRADERSPPVAGIARAVDVAEALEVVDERRHRLWRHAGRSGKVREPDSVLLEVLEDLGVGRAQVVEASRRQPLEHGRGERLVGPSELDPRVLVAEADRRIS